MASRYWVTGGTGNWNSTTNWSATTGGVSGASVPGSADAVVLDISSGAGTVTLDSNITIQTLTCTGFTGTLAFGTNTISLNSTGTVFTGATTMTVTGTPQIILTDNSATSRTINPGLVSEANAISFRITAGTGNFTMTSANAYVLNLDFTDGVNPTGYGGSYISQFHGVYGNFKASTNMTASSGTGTLTFLATSGIKTITTAAVVFDRPFNFNGVGGTWQLQDALTSGATRTCTLTAGTLDLNNFTLTTGIFTASGSTTRTIAFGTGKIVVTGNNATVCSTNTATGLTVTGNKRIEFSYSGAVGTRAVSGPASGTGIEGVNLLDYFVTAGSDLFTFNGARSYGTIDFSNSGTSTFTGTFNNGAQNIYGNLILNSAMIVGGGTSTVEMLATSGTKTITSAGQTTDFGLQINGLGGTFACADALTLGSTRALTMSNGTLQLKAGVTSTVGSFVTTGTTLKYLQSTIPGTQATISDASGTDSVTYLSVQDSNATGGATWDATASTNANAGNNTGWSLPPFSIVIGTGITIGTGISLADV
jgi:hypothetical protein